MQRSLPGLVMLDILRRAPHRGIKSVGRVGRQRLRGRHTERAGRLDREEPLDVADEAAEQQQGERLNGYLGTTAVEARWRLRKLHFACALLAEVP